jgi:hypothetical protein
MQGTTFDDFVYHDSSPWVETMRQGVIITQNRLRRFQNEGDYSLGQRR